MRAYYNEIDPFAAAWLRELIKANLIAPGDVDERSIEDVRPDDLRPYTQCHFFAGIGVWSLALRQAGWPDDRRIWTGSCPCQPFSAAGKGAGFADERHLWPAFFHLIDANAPECVVGEQVASKDGLAWLDLVQADMEGSGYAFGSVDTCAAGFGAPHQRQRLYWVADAAPNQRQGRGIRLRQGRSQQGRVAATGSGGPRGLAVTDEGQRGRVADGEGRESDGKATGWVEGDGESQSGGYLCELDHAAGARHIGASARAESKARHETRLRLPGAGCGQGGIEPAGPVNGLWRDADWLLCIDGKWRAVEPGTFPLADAGTFRNRVAELRGSGNALNLAQAQGFIEALQDVLGYESCCNAQKGEWNDH